MIPPKIVQIVKQNNKAVDFLALHEDGEVSFMRLATQHKQDVIILDPLPIIYGSGYTVEVAVKATITAGVPTEQGKR